MKIFFSLLLVMSVYVNAGERTVGLIYSNGQAADGYTLFAPMESTITYLIDNDGQLVHQWESDLNPGHSVYLLENGNLLRTQMVRNQKFNGGGSGGEFKVIDWGGETEWEFEYSSTQHLQHHDVEYLPNGNVLMIAWEVRSQSEALAAGRNPNLMFQGELWPDHIIEVQQSGVNSGEVVWEWHAWDHIIQDYDASKSNYGVVADHPELIDLNYVQNGQNGGAADWLHINSVDYNAELDQIILSVHNFSEAWIIDHSTTTAEAAAHTGGKHGKGGDLLYRFGNPQAFDHGDSSDRILYLQHHVEWIPDGLLGAGNVTVFNNGERLSSRAYSTADEYNLPVNADGNYTMMQNSVYQSPELVWSYQSSNSNDFYATNVSGVQRLENGNTLICDGPSGDFFEVTADKETVWNYINPVVREGVLEQGTVVGGGQLSKNNRVFRCVRYAPDYPAFNDKTLTPGDPIELYPAGVETTETAVPFEFHLGNYPNPFNPSTTIYFELGASQSVKVEVLNTVGQIVAVLQDGVLPAGAHQVQWNAAGFSTGIYYYRLSTENFTTHKKMTFVR